MASDSPTVISNYSLGAVALTGAYYGTSSGPVQLTNVECTGSEKTLLDCLASPVGGGEGECTHTQDVGVACEGMSP